MSEWATALPTLYAQTWQSFMQAAETRAQVALATVSSERSPEVRTVVLRHADSESQSLEIYTDLKSDKITSLRANPIASVLYWEPETRLQLRATCTTTILTGAAVMDRWDAVPDHSRFSYGVTPPPGQVIASSTGYVKDPQPEDFAVLSCAITHLDVVHLGKTHRRAAYSRMSEWQGNWLVP